MNLFLAQFRGLLGSKRGSKVSKYALFRKSEYFELELANYTSNHIGELTAIQMKHKKIL